MRTSKLLQHILPICLWLALIFHFSSQPYKVQSIKPFLQEHFTQGIVRDILPPLSFHYHASKIDAKKNPFGFIEFIFRKTAHLFVYFMLGAITYFALQPYKEKTVWKCLLILLFVGMIAMIDEWIQSKMPGRTSAIQDVGLDVVGGFVGLVSVWYNGLLTKKVR